MFTNYFKQITLATIGTSCIALGIATEAQASTGTLNISNELGFIGNTETFEFADSENAYLDMMIDDIEYFGTGVFSSLVGDVGSVYLDPLDLPGGPIDSFFTFTTFDNSFFTFNLASISLADTALGDKVDYDLMGTITDGTNSYRVEGIFSSQMMTASGAIGSSWSVTLETVPEPSTMIGLGVVAAASAFGLKKKNS